MSYPCLAAPVAVCLAHICWVGELSVMSNLTITVNESSPKESQTASCPKPPFLATCVSSWSPVQLESTEDLRTWLQAAFPASPFQSQENEPVPTIQETCGPLPSQPFAQYDPATRSWKTCQGWLVADISAPSWETWPKAGMTHAGAFYPQPSWERRIAETDCGLLPTPSAQEPGWVVGGQVEIVDKHGNPPEHANQRWYDKNTGRIVQKGLTQVVEMFPTPRANKVGGYSSPNFRPTLEQVVKARYPTPRAGSDTLVGGTGHWQMLQGTELEAGRGRLNPDWIDWLMGFPIGFTDSRPLEMHKYQLWRQQHGVY